MHINDAEIARRAALLANDYDGILPQFVPFYLFSVLYCADRANSAFSIFEKEKRSSNPVALTSAVHEALGHSAALSRFFWPTKNKGVAAARAKKLRTILHVGDESPLKDRSLRNSLEHFDERLDEYLLTYDAGYFFPAPMIGSHTLADEPVGRIFKLVDSDNNVIVILGQKCHFRPIKGEVERILNLVRPLTE